MGHLPYERLARPSAELSRLGRGASAARLLVGMALNQMAEKGFHQRLGCSSMRDYALQRCSQNGKWTEATRPVARRVVELPALEAALVQGDVKSPFH